MKSKRYIIRVIEGLGNCRAELHFEESGILSHIEFIRDGFDKAWISISEKGLWSILTTTLEESHRLVGESGVANKKKHQLTSCENPDKEDFNAGIQGLSRICKVCGKSETLVTSMVKKNRGETPIDQEECPGGAEKVEENVQ